MYSGYPNVSPISAPIPLATYMPTLSGDAFNSSSAATGSASGFSFPAPAPLFRHTSTNSTSSRYEAYQAPVLSTSSLDQGTVYRGVCHTAEPTLFQSGSAHAQLWDQQQHQHEFHTIPSKKMELPQITYPVAYNTNVASFNASLPSHVFDEIPSHVERFTSFYSAAVPAVILKALRIGLQSISEMRVDFIEQAEQGKFRCQAFTADHESIQFMIRVYKSGSAAPAGHLVEFQRRMGDSVAFFRLFQKMLKSCQNIHHGPYETSFAVAGMNFAPAFASTTAPAYPCGGALAMPNMQALKLDLPSVTSLCSMMNSDCIESKRESAKLLAQVSLSSDLFPPTLERQQSSPSAMAAAQAIWSAVDNVLLSGDDECTRLGCSLLRNCLTRGDAPMLVEHLESDRSTLQHLVSRLSEQSPADALQAREVKRQVAAVLNMLLAKKGQAWINTIAPGTTQILTFYAQQQ